MTANVSLQSFVN